MKKLFSILFLFLVLFSVGQAQETIFEEGRTIYKREASLGLKMNTSGWGGTYRYGQYLTGFSKRIYEAEIVSVSHPKEIKIFSPISNNSDGYYFGKLNSIINFRGSIGYHKTFISKQNVRGVAISYVLHAGPTFAYAKPNYLEILKGYDEKNIPIIETEVYNPEFHNQGNIYGKASWFRGSLYGQFYLGGFFKAGLNFETSRQADKINLIEVGVTLDAYFRRLPLMAEIDNSYLYFNLYAAIMFGRKKTE